MTPRRGAKKSGSPANTRCSGFTCRGIRWRSMRRGLQEMKTVSLGEVEGQRNGKEITVAALIVGVRPMRSQEGRALGHLHDSGHDRDSGDCWHFRRPSGGWSRL